MHVRENVNGINTIYRFCNVVETSYFSIEFKRSQCKMDILLVVKGRVEKIKIYTLLFNWSFFVLNNVMNAVPHKTMHMKMHRFAFSKNAPH